MLGLVLSLAVGIGCNWAESAVWPVPTYGFGWLVYLLAFARLLAFLALTMPLALVNVLPADSCSGSARSRAISTPRRSP